MNIDTDYMMTLVFFQRSIESNIHDIRIQTNNYMPLKKMFRKIILRKCSHDANLFYTFHIIKGKFLIHKTSLDYTHDYDYTTNNNENDAFIKSYIC